MYSLGHFFIVINPEFFMGLDTFEKTAGEKEWMSWQERKDKGVPVGESIQKEIIMLRDKFNLPYTFDFEK